MPSIAHSPHPLVFPVARVPAAFMAPPADLQADRLTVRTTARALDGMQKEAVVAYGASGTAWRMVCDEGPYLHGTDLAPFPLAFFCAGMASSYMSELVFLLRQRNIAFANITLLQDNRYTMEGSAIAGTMTGGALPVELQLQIESAASTSVLQQLLMDAVAASPAGALLRGMYVSEFSLTHNGSRLATLRVAATPQPVPKPPAGFDALVPAAAHDFPADIIVKSKTATVMEGVSGGVGTSLADNQKRVLHMRGVCTLRADGMKEVVVELYKPIGSQFRFLSDDSRAFGGQERAPSGLAYLSAGLAFCYMTQIGRYAGIMKQTLGAYRIVQDTCFSRPGASGATGKAASIQPVVTHVYLDSTHADEYAQRVTDMSEQTCFLHAACRQPVQVKLKDIRRNSR
jgi:organic hydroperoxide reductase OsmC/OhrA